jgi:hypothetical protein
MMISTVDRLRLAALLGMLGSSHGGERENAARLVEQFRRQRGLNWGDLLGRPDASGQGAASPFPPEYGSPPFGRAYRRWDLVWRWLMLLGLAAVGLMSFTSLAEQHAVQKWISARLDGACVAGACPEDDTGGPGTGRHSAADPMPAPFLQGLADRKLYEAWRAAGPAGLCLTRRPDRKDLSPDCPIVRKLLAQFEHRRRTDPVYLAGWTSLTQ